MANYLDPTNIKDALFTAERHMKPYFEPIPEYERLARNKPHPKVIAMKLPNVTDGRLAAATYKQPKRTIQQLPTGRIYSLQYPELGRVIDYDWQNNIIPHALTNGNLLLKSWTISTKALTYGYQPSIQFMSARGTFTGGDFRLPYVRDILLPQGTVYAPDARVIFAVTWWTKYDIQAEIAKQKKVKANDPTHDGGWDLETLAKLLNELERKPDDKKGAAEREKNDDSGFAKLVACYQEGIDSKFYLWSTKLNKVVRTWTNPDPRGYMPVKFMYADIDLSNPMGRGNIELAGGMQNLLDSEMQAYQFMQRLMMNPPLLKFGNSVVAQTVKWKPNAIWNMGSDVNSKLEPVPMNTQALSNFTQNYSLIASEIDQLVGNGNNTISSSAGNPSSSKTSQGVKATAANLSIDDNFLRKQYEAWFQEMAGDIINLTYAQKTATETIKLSEQFLGQLPDAFKSKAVTIDKLNGTGTINYGMFKGAMDFTVDAGSSKKEDDQEQIDALTQLVTDSSKNPYLSYYMGNDGYELHLGEAYKQLFQRLGIYDIDRIVTKLPIDPNTGQPQASSGVTPTFDKPIVRINFQDLPPAAQVSALQNAGITVQDPTAVNQPNVHQQITANAQNPAPVPPKSPMEQVDLGDIYKVTTSPSVRAQIETMIGLQPDLENTTNEMDTLETEHAAKQAEAIHAVSPDVKPMSATEQAQAETQAHQAETARMQAETAKKRPVGATS